MSWVAAAGLAINVGGSLYAGSQKKKAGKATAAALRRQAAVKRGEGHYEAEEELRQARYLESRALAVAAASGGGVSNPTVTNIRADIQAEGSYRALLRRYSADTEAQGLEDAAYVAKKGGDAAGVAAGIDAATTLFTEGADLWKRYQTSKPSKPKVIGPL